MRIDIDFEVAGDVERFVSNTLLGRYKYAWSAQRSGCGSDALSFDGGSYPGVGCLSPAFDAAQEMGQLLDISCFEAIHRPSYPWCCKMRFSVSVVVFSVSERRLHRWTSLSWPYWVLSSRQWPYHPSIVRRKSIRSVVPLAPTCGSANVYLILMLPSSRMLDGEDLSKSWSCDAPELRWNRNKGRSR